METIIGVLVVGFIVYLLFFKKGKGGSSSQESGSNTNSSSDHSSSDDNNDYIDSVKVESLIREYCTDKKDVLNWPLCDAQIDGQGWFNNMFNEIELEFDCYGNSVAFAGFDMDGAFDSEIKKRIEKLKNELNRKYPNTNFKIKWKYHKIVYDHKI